MTERRTVVIRVLIYEGPEKWVKEVCMERRAVKGELVAETIPGEPAGGTIKEVIAHETTYERNKP